ncbi:hypothetical protein ASPWEDRAFT_168455 [Aspergillus wentii DTO 134E9]|uniref:RRM domain-containing protein n=1 Tax=Aspergillus wentii DTO 134E9 TaxID=1073089 RepID=A0A1L9RUJ3_ASPWE|nr:uncharacterized protein ASPWEDRAFT_168455 [Aspergillus wentii DTO 134E9]OJJ38553.1 hypothetical protein ASPWEDRAFT_168455 [Aspergillus wentii DTO 134E9]
MRGNDSSHILSSPCSTNGAISPHGSPDTKLTAFSPEDMRSKDRSDSSVGAAMKETDFRKFYSIPSSDPFLVSASTSNRAQLSPTAASFTPIGMTGRVVAGSQIQSLSRECCGVSYLTPNADLGTRGPIPGTMKSVERGTSDYGPIGNTQLAMNSILPSASIEKFDTERRSRAFVIENVPTNLSYMSLAGFFNRREFGTLKGPVLTELSSMGKVYVAFTDSREAKNAMEKVHLLRPEWRIFALTSREYIQHSEPSRLAQTSDFEGQLFVSVYYDSRNSNMNHHRVARSLETLAMTFGDMKIFSPLPSKQDHVSEFHLEFFNTRDAENAMTTLNGTSVDDCVLEVSLFKPDVEDKSYLPLPSPSTPVKGGFSRYETAYRNHDSWASSRTNHTPYMELSPTGRSTVPSGEHAGLMDWMSRAGERILPSPHREISRYPDLRSNNQNAVDIERIRLGLDVRTTIMLRNIPNKIDQAMLKTIVDETSHGKYDFMYLRIDFANNCNVGYAFINFEDPIDIIDFINVRSGRTWNCFNSDKVAEVSYASKFLNTANFCHALKLGVAIQGKDCLVQKFRNSSVMLEHPSFRPKIFHTGAGPLVGTEDRFPGPDNPSKMRRSIENAEHVGLFAPRVGQQYRDEQRRRHSQFDRGTTAAEREVFYVQTLAPRRPSGVNNGLRSAPCTYPGMKMWYGSTITDRGPRTS